MWVEFNVRWVQNITVRINIFPNTREAICVGVEKNWRPFNAMTSVLKSIDSLNLTNIWDNHQKTDVIESGQLLPLILFVKGDLKGIPIFLSEPIWDHFTLIRKELTIPWVIANLPVVVIYKYERRSTSTTVSIANLISIFREGFTKILSLCFD